MSSRRVLLIEDDKMLLTVYEMYLKELGHQVVGAFNNADSALAGITGISPDIALIDIHLPGKINGIRAAEILQKDYDIPVIFISSYTDEKTVNKAVQVYSYGYLVKPVDKTALKITIDLAYAKHAFEKSFYVQNLIVDNLDIAVFSMSLTSKITFWNHYVADIFGIEPEMAMGKELTFLLPHMTDEEIQTRIIEPTLSAGKYTFVTEIADKNFVPLKYALTFQVNKSHQDIYGLVCHVVKEEDSSASSIINYHDAFFSVFNNIPKILTILNRSAEIVFFNYASEKFARQTLKKALRKNDSFYSVFDFFDIQDFQNLLTTAMEGVTHFLERQAEINGKLHFFQIIVFPIISKQNEDIDTICVSMQDISRDYYIEKELEETRNELKPLFDSSIQRFYLCDLNYNLVSFNKAAKDIIIKEQNRVLKKGDCVLDFVPAEITKDGFSVKFEEAKKGTNIVMKQRVGEGDEKYWLETHIDPILNEKGEIYRILVWTIDVSEREQSLMELKATQDRYMLVARGGNDGIWDWDILNNTVYLSPRWKNVLGYEDHELPNEFGMRDGLIHPDDLKKSHQIIDDYLSGKIKEYQNEIRLRHKNGNYLWVIERGELLTDENNKPIRLAGSITDISEIKKKENEIRESNTMLLQERNMFIQGNVVIARVKAGNIGSTIFISENIENVLGYKPSDFYESRITYDMIIHPEDLDTHRAERNEAVHSNRSHVAYSPYRLIGKNNSIVWVKDFATFIKNEKGEITEILGYFVDMTSEKKWEAALFESQKKYFSLFNEANDGIIIIDGENITDCNSKFEEMFGYKKEEIIGKKAVILSPDKQPDGSLSNEKRTKKIKDAIEQKKSTFYWKYKRKNGEEFDSEVSLSSIKIDAKTYLHVSVRDITQRKEIERSLKLSQHKFQSLLDAIPDLLFIINREGVYTYFKPDYLNELAVPDDTVVGKHISEFFSGEELLNYEKMVKNAFEENTVQVLRYKLNSPKGIKQFEGRFSCISKDEVLLVVRVLD